MTTYGYMRVSTRAQGSKYGLERQKKVLLDNGVSEEDLVSDEITGVKRSRKGLDYLLETAQEGDTIKLVSLDRLGRDTIDCLSLIEQFSNMGVGLVFIKENIDTTDKGDAMSKAFIGIASVFAQLERDRMLERQEETYEVMRENNIPIGRPRVDEDKLNTAVEMYLAGKGSYRKISKIVGISPAKICLAVNGK